jgi:hypothetical protein
MNIFALCQFNGKNPAVTPITMAEIKEARLK